MGVQSERVFCRRLGSNHASRVCPGSQSTRTAIALDFLGENFHSQQRLSRERLALRLPQQQVPDQRQEEGLREHLAGPE